MFKKLILFLLIISFSAAVSAKTTYHTIRTRIFDREKGLLINQKIYEGEWDFKYKISTETRAKSGMISDGPMMMYTATIINGEFMLDSLHPEIAAAVKNNKTIKIDYINKKEGEKDDKVFSESKIKTIRMIMDDKGRPKVLYTFRAGDAR